MKKTSTLLAALAWAGSAFAQGDASGAVQFVNAAGSVIADGTTLVVSEAEMFDDGFDVYPVLNSGLYVRNASDAAQAVLIDVTLSAISGGAFQICFPTTCMQLTTPTQWTSQPGRLDAGAPAKDLQSEWIPMAYGECVATYQVKVCDLDPLLGATSDVIALGPKVTVHYVYADPASLEDVGATQPVPVAYYGLDGRRLSAPQRGINLVRLSDGRTVKQIVKD